MRIVDFTAEFIPDLGEIGGHVFVFDVHLDGGEAGHGKTGDILDLSQFLNRGLEGVGNLFGHLHGGGAGIISDNLGGFDGEFRIFKAPKLLVRLEPPEKQQHRKYDRDDLFIDRQLRDIHCRASSPSWILYSRTDCPS